MFEHISAHHDQETISAADSAIKRPGVQSLQSITSQVAGRSVTAESQYSEFEAHYT
jgi:hypothetical protein